MIILLYVLLCFHLKHLLSKLAINGSLFFLFKQVITPIRIERWAVVNFSARCDTSYLSRELINCGRNKGIVGFPIFFLLMGITIL